MPSNTTLIWSLSVKTEFCVCVFCWQVAWGDAAQVCCCDDGSD
jgi:hypothetical protein